MTDAVTLQPSERWYCVQAQPRKETLAIAHLRNHAFRTFMPVLWKKTSHARKVQTVKVPFFPGYFFTALNVHRDAWRKINGSLGVVSLLMTGDRPLPVPDGVVEALHDLTARPSDVEVRQKLPVGPVRVVAGPLAGHLGRLLAEDGHGRARVLLAMMGAQRPVTFSSSCLAEA